MIRNILSCLVYTGRFTDKTKLSNKIYLQGFLVGDIEGQDGGNDAYVPVNRYFTVESPEKR